MQFVGLTCLGGLTAMTMFQTYALDRQVEAVERYRQSVPPAFLCDVTLAEHQAAADRLIRRAQGQRLSALWSVAAAIILLVVGCPAIDSLAAWLTLPGMPRQMLILGLLATIVFLACMPGRYYARRFVISRSTTRDARSDLRAYLAGQARLFAFGVVLGAPLAWGILSLLRGVQPLWWLYGWLALVAALILAPVLHDRVLVPRLGTLTPVSRPVGDRVAAILKQVGIKTTGIFENAPAAWSGNHRILILGAGSARRVVIPAWLLRILNADEIAVIVAHELAHGLARHGMLRLAARAFMLLMGIGLFSLLINQSWLASASGVHPDATAYSFFVSLLLLGAAGKAFAVASHSAERHFDFQADSFVNGLHGPEALTRALVKLSTVSGSCSLASDPLYSLINDAVPPAAMRITRLQATAPAMMPVGQAAESVPMTEQLTWIGRSGLLTFRKSDAAPDRSIKAQQPGSADAAGPARKKRRRNPATATKRPRMAAAAG